MRKKTASAAFNTLYLIFSASNELSVTPSIFANPFPKVSGVHAFMLALLGHANATVSTLLPLSTKCFSITCVALNTPLLIIAFLIIHPGTSGLLSSPIQSPNLPRQRPNHLPFNRHPTYSLSTSQVASSSMSSELRKEPTRHFLP